MRSAPTAPSRGAPTRRATRRRRSGASERRCASRNRRSWRAPRPAAAGTSSWSSAHGDVVATGRDLELGAPILRPRGLVLALRRGTFLAHADDLDSTFLDAAVGQVALRGRRAALPERKVVLIRATTVGVAGDAETNAGIRGEHRKLRIVARASV